jgi:O-antigen/teichoic acid export membrane protein
MAHYRGEAAAGAVSALLYAAIAPNLLLVALGQVSITRLSRAFFLRQRATFLQNLRRLLFCALFLAGLTFGTAFFCGGPLLRLVYGSRLQIYSSELTLFSAAGSLGLLSTAIGYGISSARVFAPQLPMMLSVCAVSVICCRILIPGSGLRGVAWAQIVSNSLQLALNFALFSHLVLRELKQEGDARVAG